MSGTEGQDWASYQALEPSVAGLGFVIIKATEGTGYVNPRYHSQVATARRGHLVPGHYHFAKSTPDMKAQADYFLAHIDLKPGEVIAFDWEASGVSCADKDAWIRYVKSKCPGHRVILYCNIDYWKNHDTTGYAGDGLWIADPNHPKGSPNVKAPWLFHQYSEAGGIDRDWTPMSLDQLRSWASGSVPVSPEVAQVEWTDKFTLTDKTYTGGKPMEASMEQWVAYGNLKAERAMVAAEAAANGVKTLAEGVSSMSVAIGEMAAKLATGLGVTLTDEQVAQLGDRIATNDQFAQAVADKMGADMAKRLQA
jgi:hypothetical protein